MTNEFDYGCVLLHLKFDNWYENITNFDADDLDFTQLESGICMDPHLTILYGIHDDVPLLDVERIIATINKSEIDIKLGPVDSFINGEYEVVKIPVESEYLTELNKKFRSLPHTSSFPDYKPHITLAYVKPGMSEKYKTMYINTPLAIGEIEYSNKDIVKKY